MSEDLSMPADDASREQFPPVPTELVAVPDDPEDATEVIVQREDASTTDLATEWITLAVDDLENLQDWQ